MDSLVWAMSEMTPSEMMRRMKYSDPSFTNDAYLHNNQTDILLNIPKATYSAMKVCNMESMVLQC